MSKPGTPRVELEESETRDESDEPVFKSISPDPVTAAASKSPDPAFLWLRRGDQVFVSLMIAALLGLLGIQWLQLSRWGHSPIEVKSLEPREYYYTLDINTASWVEWAQLDGIGETLARKIVADREARGPFLNPKDVGRVKGIQPKLPKMLPFLRGGTDPPADNKRE